MIVKNKIDQQGRVNIGIPSYGITIGPHEDNFDLNIEHCVKDIVYSLINLGYKTVGSCQGHHWVDNPFVIIAFNGVEDANTFCLILKKYWFLRGWVITDKIIDDNGPMNVSVDNVNAWYNTNFKEVVCVQIELRSELFLFITNLNVIKKAFCSRIAKLLEESLPQYSEITNKGKIC